MEFGLILSTLLQTDVYCMLQNQIGWQNIFKKLEITVKTAQRVLENILFSVRNSVSKNFIFTLRSFEQQNAKKSLHGQFGYLRHYGRCFLRAYHYGPSIVWWMVAFWTFCLQIGTNNSRQVLNDFNNNIIKLE